MATETHDPIAQQPDAGLRMANVVREAWLATSELGEDITPATREEAFKLVLAAMLGVHGSESAGAGQFGYGSEPAALFDDPDDHYSTPELRSDGISDYLRIQEEGVPALFDVRLREPMVQVDPLALSDSKRVALRELALLELAGRTAVGLDTNQAHIQSTVERYQACDGKSYVPRLLACDDVLFLGRPSNGERLVRLTGSGVGTVRKLAQRLLAS